ncbi:GGDEF domain-containing protein [Pseudoxanthomonas suwonensis]|uniref:GGDEF domain-containing protein n=1 Tax=Pseudoxanthomonas suwonensis TaxID=314722 RepID=UPI000314BA4A|nr:GGDEF domain-containing protein [Pseudoxanthomonas suwonensis]
MVVLFGYTVLDLFVAPKPIMAEVVALRLSLMVMPLLLLLAASYRQQWRSILHHIAGAACLCAALGAVTLVVRSRYQGLPLDYEGVLLVLMYMYGCGAMRLRTAIVCGTTTTIVYPLAEAWVGLPQDILVVRTMFIVTTNIIGIITAWVLDQEGRGNFLMARQLRGMAQRDYLTGLPNRRAFAERIDAVWQQARGEQRPLGIALMDVDWFKAYNDRYGHPAGDRVLRAVGRVLGAHARGPLDMVARHGGEEFVCVWYDATLAEVETTLAAIHADIASLGIEHAGSHVPGNRLTISIGLHYLYPQAGKPPTEALLRADQALYEAKASGRHTTVVTLAEPISQPPEEPDDEMPPEAVVVRGATD